MAKRKNVFYIKFDETPTPYVSPYNNKVIANTYEIFSGNIVVKTAMHIITINEDGTYKVEINPKGSAVKAIANAI